MLTVLLIVLFCVVVVFIGLRIVLGWVLPRETVAAFDRAMQWGFGFVFKLSIVALAIAIVALIWYVAKNS